MRPWLRTASPSDSTTPCWLTSASTILVVGSPEHLLQGVEGDRGAIGVFVHGQLVGSVASGLVVAEDDGCHPSNAGAVGDGGVADQVGDGVGGDLLPCA